MFKMNKAVSVVVLACFLFNTAVSDLAFGQSLDRRANAYKLAAPLKLSDIVGIQHKDMGDIELWFLAFLRGVNHNVGEITVENMQKYYDSNTKLLGKTIFQLPGAQLFIHEARTEGDAIRIQLRRKDNKHGSRTYYVEYNTSKQGIKAYTEKQYMERTTQIKEKDAAAIRGSIARLNKSSKQVARATGKITVATVVNEEVRRRHMDVSNIIAYPEEEKTIFVVTGTSYKTLFMVEEDKNGNAALLQYKKGSVASIIESYARKSDIHPMGLYSNIGKILFYEEDDRQVILVYIGVGSIYVLHRKIAPGAPASYGKWIGEWVNNSTSSLGLKPLYKIMKGYTYEGYSDDEGGASGLIPFSAIVSYKQGNERIIILVSRGKSYMFKKEADGRLAKLPWYKKSKLLGLIGKDAQSIVSWQEGDKNIILTVNSNAYVSMFSVDREGAVEILERNNDKLAGFFRKEYFEKYNAKKGMVYIQAYRQGNKTRFIIAPTLFKEEHFIPNVPIMMVERSYRKDYKMIGGENNLMSSAPDQIPAQAASSAASAVEQQEIAAMASLASEA